MDKTPTDEMKENEYTLEGQARQQALESIEGLTSTKKWSLDQTTYPLFILQNGNTIRSNRGRAISS